MDNKIMIGFKQVVSWMVVVILTDYTKPSKQENVKIEAATQTFATVTTNYFRMYSKLLE
jgi:hypothetical protein